MVGVGHEKGDNNQEEYTKQERAGFLIDGINQYKDLAWATKEVGIASEAEQ